MITLLATAERCCQPACCHRRRCRTRLIIAFADIAMSCCWWRDAMLPRLRARYAIQESSMLCASAAAPRLRHAR